MNDLSLLFSLLVHSIHPSPHSDFLHYYDHGHVLVLDLILLVLVLSSWEEVVVKYHQDY